MAWLLETPYLSCHSCCRICPMSASVAFRRVCVTVLSRTLARTIFFRGTALRKAVAEYEQVCISRSLTLVHYRAITSTFVEDRWCKAVNANAPHHSSTAAAVEQCLILSDNGCLGSHRNLRSCSCLCYITMPLQPQLTRQLVNVILLFTLTPYPKAPTAHILA